MFKKPLSNLKTSAPLRSSDRRKLKQRVISTYSLTPEEGDLLVPDGILSVKFSTHVGEPGIAYLDVDGDPLWFSIGKNASDGELIPTIYTLWKKQDLLPFLSTPSAVVPILIGGADLMIPGVIHCPPSLPSSKLVAIRQYARKDPNSPPSLSPPVAVGRLALPSDQLRAVAMSSSSSTSASAGSNAKEAKKGKAVLVAHTWKDHLWDMGRKGDMPEDTVLDGSASKDDDDDDEEEESEEETGEEDGEDAADNAMPPPPSEAEVEVEGAPPLTSAPPPAPEPSASSSSPSTSPTKTITYTPAEITSLLTHTLHQAISTTLGALPPSAFPIPATQFYSSYILPSRPAFPWVVLPPSSSSSSSSSGTSSGNRENGGQDTADQDQDPPRVDPEISIKSSSHKSLTAFLKSAEKSSLLTLKPAPSNKADVVVTSVNPSHPSVVAHKPFVTLGEVEARKARKAEREERAGRERVRVRGEVEVRELWRAVGGGTGRGAELVEGLGGSKSNLYTAPEIRTLLNTYITTHNLVNPRDQAYINLDELLYACLSSSSSTSSSKAKSGKGKDHNKEKGKGKDNSRQDDAEEGMDRFMRRDELLKRVLGCLQAWYEVRVEGRDAVLKKGPPAPITITMKVRQGRKACTLITGFEPFLVLDAEEMGEALRRVCAGSTSVSPIPGKSSAGSSTAAPAMEVLVQGKQAPAVVGYLMSKGIPKRWIEVVDLVGKK